MSDSPRAAALVLSEEVLTDIELARVPPIDIARKASRLARLLNDGEAMEWLRHEIDGYVRTADNKLDQSAWAAATRSNRVRVQEDGKWLASATSLGELQMEIDAGMSQIAAAADAPVSISSANPNQYVSAPMGNTTERSLIRSHVAKQKALLDRVLGAVHSYVAARYHELRFGSAVETAFEIVRERVDRNIGELVPSALPMLSAALENVTSDNPEHWANAVATCRRLLRAAADALRPPGEDVNGRKMGEEQYINRLVDWITSRSSSDTLADVMISDLEYLGRRLDAVQEAGSKGTHAAVGQVEASRFITGTYLLLGDILNLGAAGGTGGDS